MEEFKRLHSKLVSIIHNPEYLSYHLHITFEINFQHLFNTPTFLPSQPSPNGDNNNFEKTKIDGFVKYLEEQFGLRNFTIISLPISNNTAYIQYLTTCKFNTTPIIAPKLSSPTPLALSPPNTNDIDLSNYEVFTYFNTLFQLQVQNVINAIGFKIEGVVFPAKKPVFVQQLESNPNLNGPELHLKHPEFCYFETHRKVPTIEGLHLQPNELISYSFKNQCYMSAFREYNITQIPKALAKYEVCIYETWTKDIEKDWKTAMISNGTFAQIGINTQPIKTNPASEQQQQQQLHDQNHFYHYLFIQAVEQIQNQADCWTTWHTITMWSIIYPTHHH